MELNNTKVNIKNVTIYDRILFVLFLIFYTYLCIPTIEGGSQSYIIINILTVTTFIFYCLIYDKKYFKINKTDEMSIYQLLPLSFILNIFFMTFYNIALIYTCACVFLIAIFEQDYLAFLEPVNAINIVSFLVTIICLIISILLITKRKISKAAIYAFLPSLTFLFATVIKKFC